MFTAKIWFSLFDYFVTAHAIIAKIIGLVYLIGKIILISTKKLFFIIFVAVWIKFGSKKWSELLVTHILKPCFIMSVTPQTPTLKDLSSPKVLSVILLNSLPGKLSTFITQGMTMYRPNWSTAKLCWIYFYFSWSLPK